ncbi:carbohydrate ABC transporter permease [Chthonobacter rhizosphaerae]|uniref:carbohydrate ABC transporter permease n=1 Tax=Chthonobacter rhizosphaerae TaxID=2735553 RepID=UPI0015EEA4DD|nr:carbohydrate ABC transporter permease [Chthonobacter rhizosphaerae]
MTTRSERLLQLALALLVVLIVLAPLALMVATSLKGDEGRILLDIGSLAAFWVSPGEASLTNYVQVLSSATQPFLRFLFNSVFVVGWIVGVGIFVNSAAAFALSRMRFRGRNLILAVVVALIIIPMEALAIPLLLMVNRVGWLDSYQAQIVPFIAHPFSIFLFYQFFAKLPKDIDEAAYVEGASPFQVYWKIALPLSGPVIATVAILQSLEYWNAYLWPLMVTRGPEVRPVSLALAQFFGTPPPTWGDLMAFSVMMSLPILILYLAFQRWFIQSVVASAVK